MSSSTDPFIVRQNKRKKKDKKRNRKRKRKRKREKRKRKREKEKKRKREQEKSLREFEGSLTKHSPDVLGLFVSPLGYSKNSIKFAFTSSRPLMLATFTLGEDSSKDRLVQIAMSNSFMRLSSGLKVLYKSVVLQSVKKKRTSQYEVMTQNDSHRREMEDGKENENENEIEIENEDEIENENENENIVSNEEVERQDFVKQKIVLWYNNTRILSTDDHLQ